MDKIPKISDAEWKVMKIIWANNKITSANIVQALKDKTKWKKATVKSLINRLLNKKAIGFTKVGSEYYYFPIISEDECMRLESHSFINKVFDGSMKSMLLAFARSKEISQTDVEELKKILNQSNKIEG